MSSQESTVEMVTEIRDDYIDYCELLRKTL